MLKSIWLDADAHGTVPLTLAKIQPMRNYITDVFHLDPASPDGFLSGRWRSACLRRLGGSGVNWSEYAQINGFTDRCVQSVCMTHFLSALVWG